MSRIFTLALVCLVMAGVVASVTAETLVEKSNYLYLKIGNATAYTRYSRTDTMQTIGQLPLQVKFNDPAFADSTLEGITIKFNFNNTLAEFKSVTLDTAWTGTVSTTRITAGSIDTVTVRLRAGTGKPCSSFKTYAFLNLSPICGSTGDSTTAHVKFSPAAQTDDYISLHNGYVYSPDGVNQTEGVLYRHTYAGDGFDIQDTTLVDAIGDTVEIPVWGATFSRIHALYHYILVDQDKLQLTDIQFSGRWTGITFADISGDTIFLYMENNSLIGTEELNMDSALYTLRFKVLPAAANSTTGIYFLGDTCHYSLPGCTQWQGGSTVYLDGGVTVSDNAELCIEPQTASPSVRKQVANIRHNIKLSNTFDAGIPGTDTMGVKIAMDLGHSAFTLASPTSGGTNYTWHYATTDGRGAVWQWNADGLQSKRLIPSSQTCTTIGTVDLRWNAPDSVVNWNNQYIVPDPTVIASYGGYTTSTPAYDGSWTATMGDGLIAGAFSEPIKVLMSQPGTNTVSANPDKCVWQTLRIRNNFTLASCSLVVQAAAGSHFGDYANLRAGLSVVQISTTTWAVRGVLTTPIAASTSFTDLGQIRIDRNSCNGSPVVVSMSVVHSSSKVKLYESGAYYEAYVARFDSGAATITCPSNALDCDFLIGPETPTDVESDNSGLPKVFALKQNFPNPFNPMTTISLELPTRADWKITIYNISGQMVKAFEGSSSAGVVNVTWDASACASGVYLYKAEAGTFVETKKMMLIK